MDYLTCSAAAKLAPGRPSSTAVWRWMTKGIIRHGTRVKLEHLRMGGKLLTTESWVVEFGKALAEIEPEIIPVTKTIRQEKPTSRDRRVADARAELYATR